MVVLGLGGHARTITALFRTLSIPIDAYFDYLYSDTQTDWVGEIPIIRTIEKIPVGSVMIIGIGDNELRRQQYLNFEQFVTKVVVSKNCSMPQASSNRIGVGTVVLFNTYIGPFASIGKNTIINNGAIVEHDVSVGDHCHISVNATIAGGTIIGDGCLVGAGATVIDRLRIAPNTVVGAGATIVRSIDQSGVYVGTPARRIR